MSSFIEVARLENYRLENKEEEEETRHPQPISAKTKSPIKSELFRILTHSM